MLRVYGFFSHISRRHNLKENSIFLPFTIFLPCLLLLYHKKRFRSFNYGCFFINAVVKHYWNMHLLCMMSQPLWINRCIVSVVSRRAYFFRVILQFWLLKPLCLLFHINEVFEKNSSYDLMLQDFYSWVFFWFLVCVNYHLPHEAASQMRDKLLCNDM